MSEPKPTVEEHVESADSTASVPEKSPEPAKLVDKVRYEPLPEQRVHILLTEYHEAIETLRNWDKIIFQMLSIVGSVAAAIVAFTAQGGSPVAWGAVFSLILFWLFSYVWQIKVANQRIIAIRAIEDELNMAGQYRLADSLKTGRTVIFWIILPYLGGFVIGPLLGYFIANRAQIAQFFGGLIP